MPKGGRQGGKVPLLTDLRIVFAFASPIDDADAWFIRVLVNHCLRVQRHRRIWRWFRPDRQYHQPALTIDSITHGR